VKNNNGNGKKNHQTTGCLCSEPAQRVPGRSTGARHHRGCAAGSGVLRAVPAQPSRSTGHRWAEPAPKMQDLPRDPRCKCPARMLLADERSQDTGPPGTGGLGGSAASLPWGAGPPAAPAAQLPRDRQPLDPAHQRREPPERPSPQGMTPPCSGWTSRRPHGWVRARSSATGTQPAVGAEPCRHAAGFGTESAPWPRTGPSRAAQGILRLSTLRLTARRGSAPFRLVPHPGTKPPKGVTATRRGPKPDWMLSQPLITPASTRAEITIRLINPSSQAAGAGGPPHAPPAPGMLAGGSVD